MKIVMTLLVRDEEDILETHLRYHLSRGVDQFIVTDNLSMDSTPQILEKFVREGKCVVLEESGNDFSQARWVTRMARIAAEELDADWLIHSDADEFWWTRETSFADALAAVPDDVGILEADRYDFLPRPESEGPPFDRMTFRDERRLNSLGRPLPPNVVHRAHPEAVVAQGNHDVSAPGLERSSIHKPFTVLHFPLRTFEQFTHKIVIGGEAYERNTELHPSIGDVRRQLYSLHKKGGLEPFWHQQVLDSPELEQQIEKGSLKRDVRLRNYLRNGFLH